MPPASPLAPHPALNAIAARSTPLCEIDFIVIVHLPSLSLASSTAFDKIQAFHMLCRLPVEIPLNKVRLGERIQGESHAVAVDARRPDHLLVRSQIVVLVMLHEYFLHLTLFSLLPRQVAGRAADAGALRERARFLQRQKLGM